MTSELEALTHQVGEAFVLRAPIGWVTGTIDFCQVGKTGEMETVATMPDGSRIPFSPDRSAVRALHQMRTLMARPGTGAWFSARCRLRAPGWLSFDFDYDNEPAWSTPTSVGHYLEEAERHPRSPEHTPPWLARRLVEAKAWETRGS